MKTELEEAAENYGWKVKRNTFSTPVKANELAESAIQDFKEGAKWQAERMYSEKERCKSEVIRRYKNDELIMACLQEGILFYMSYLPKYPSKNNAIEEAKRLYPIVIKPIFDVYDDGLKHQIGEEDINEDKRESFIEGAKYIQKRMYGEQDMIEFMQFIISNLDLSDASSVSESTAKYYIEQFKKNQNV